MSEEDSLVQIRTKPKLLVLDGGREDDQIDLDTAFSSELFFSNQIFRGLLDQLKGVTDQLKVQTDTDSQNLFRRGMRLLGIGLQLARKPLFIKSNELSRSPISDVYKFIEELLPFFKDSKQEQSADFLGFLLTNEVVSEIVTNLMARHGRERSAAALAIHFGLVESEDAQDLLQAFELSAEDLPQCVNAALHDVTEIRSQLQYKGNIDDILSMSTLSANNVA